MEGRSLLAPCHETNFTAPLIQRPLGWNKVTSNEKRIPKKKERTLSTKNLLFVIIKINDGRSDDSNEIEKSESDFLIL